ncbi:TPA: hypothetical protein N2N31_002945 [Escherichia coli]|nr:hypothetical protein [Escherichia coli]
MSLVNWEEHRARFIALREEKGITVKEYCEEHGLSFNTARKHLNMKKNEVRSQVKTTKKSTKSPEKNGREEQQKSWKRVQKKQNLQKLTIRRAQVLSEVCRERKLRIMKIIQIITMR